VLVHAPGQLFAVGLRASDGEAAFTLPAANAPPPFEPAGLLSLALDGDGTLLAAARAPQAWGRALEYSLLYRMTQNGETLPTWPGGAPTREADLGTDIPRLDKPFSAVTAVAFHPTLIVGHDGHAYLCDSRWLVRLTRGGTSEIAFPAPRADFWDDRCLGVDEGGTVHGLTSEALLRIDRECQLAQRLPRRSAGGPLGSERLLAVAPDGTAAMADSGSMLRVVRPDGVVSFVSAASRKADES
jgi:hypothetical protein